MPPEASCATDAPSTSMTPIARSPAVSGRMKSEAVRSGRCDRMTFCERSGEACRARDRAAVSATFVSARRS